ncbi:TetR/AcrR family transcriptional regulator [Sneathiella marina]|uniref:TetR/AcrR family transcriptional regulator n=1 Tax=Sneathiella marina TaxID=2950108 RepID=A0ABY4W2A8_9PROT|nr:TetR/AcrR family transcriptional regulator [Sneathiella marina]USG61102.1 TetR/AcrR family transcriptional regulator [Sneathiella marina]
MARPTVKDERQKQILDAFATCVARYGVEGATLEKTAKQAGLARALIRHNVGNRIDLLDALLEQFLENSRHVTEDMVSALPEHNRTRTLCDWLFDPSSSDAQLVLVANALIAAASTNKTLARKMREWMHTFVAAINQVITEEYPEANVEKVSAVALGVTGIYFNVEALYPLGNVTVLAKDSKRAALLLLDTLEAN